MKNSKNTSRRYYSGINLITGQTILTTSTTKLSTFLNISRATVSRHIQNEPYYISKEYIIMLSNEIIKQDKGNYKDMRAMNSIWIDKKREIADYVRGQM